jgi:hypothetical protein
MELTDEELEVIRDTAKAIEYGSLTIHVSEVSNHLDLEIHKRIRKERKQTPQKI